MATDVGTLAVQLGMVWNKRAEAAANAKLDGSLLDFAWIESAVIVPNAMPVGICMEV